MKIGFDYDGTLSTSKGKELATQNIKAGDAVYIISARSMKTGLIATADKLGIPHNRVFATGSNPNKIKKVQELGLDQFVDNNPDVISQLPGVGKKF